ncbi:MAG: tail fiber domain-containing protein, partial [Rhodothermia bacterium]
NSATKGFTFAAGQRAKANHSGAFVWADSASTVGVDFSSTNENQFLIRASGGVGIGTNAPAEALQVKRASGGTGIFLGGDGTDGPRGIVFDDDVSGAGVQLFWRVNPNQLILERTSGGTGVDGTDAFFYDRDDDVFGFDGLVRPITDNTHDLGTSSLRWSTVYAANGVVNTSDARLQRVVEDLDSGLETVLGLRPVRYRWTDGPDDEHYLGLIAQEVENIIPEVVVPPKAEDEFYGLNYSELVPVLIKAVQEQQAELDRLRTANGDMTDKMLSHESAMTN